MNATAYIWINGEFIEWSNATTHTLSHGLHYGSGVYDGIRAYKTKDNTAIFRLDEHVERFIFSSNTIKLKHGYTKEEIKQAIIDTIKINNLDEAYIRTLSYNGYGTLGVGVKNKTETVIACWKWDKYHGNTHPHGLDVKTSSYIRIHPKSTIVDAKICGHYVNGMLALQELDDTHYHEALMLDADGYVSECSSANIFVIKDNIIYTPKLGTILPGITRDFVIKLARDLDIKIQECNLTPTDVKNADEVFFTGTAVELTQMRSLDDVIIGNSKDYPIFNKLKDEFQQTVRGYNHKYKHYITYVN